MLTLDQRSSGIRHSLISGMALLIALSAALPAGASPTKTTSLPPQLQGVGLDQKVNQRLPLELQFRDETGRAVMLGDYFHSGRPVILTLVYYQCPMLCTMVLNGLVRSLRAVDLEAGRDFDIVTVSFNPRETPALAAEKKSGYLARYEHPGAGPAWHFLTGDETSIRKLTEAVGFHYRYDAASGQFAHPSGIQVLTPDARLARYFYGVEYSPRDLRLGLVEASAGKFGSPVDQVLLFCYHYDPATGKYGFVIWSAIRASSLLVLLVLIVLLWRMFRRDFGGQGATEQAAGLAGRSSHRPVL